MKKISKLQKILITIFMIIIAGLVKSSAVQGVYFSGYSDLKSSKTYYCIEHQDAFTEGEWDAVSVDRYTSADSSQTSRALAYILSEGDRTGNGGYNNYSIYQIAVWKWYYNQGINTTWPSSYSDEGLFDTASSIGVIPYSENSEANITASSSTFSMEGLEGSIKLTSLTGTVSSIEITWKDTSGNAYTKSFESGTGIDDWIRLYSDSSYSKTLDISNISKGTFYIKNLNTDYRIVNVKITTTTDASGYIVDVTRWKKTTGTSSQQDLISASVTRGTAQSASITLKADYSYGRIKLVKQGIYTENGTEKTEDVTAKFKIYCTTLKKWVAGDADTYKTYVDNISDATEYTSGTIVRKLFAGYDYRIYEISIEHEYYKDIKMVNAIANVNGQESTLSVGKDSTTGLYRTTAITVTEQDTTGTITLTIYDQRTRGDMTIYKIDKDTAKAIPGVKIKIYQKDQGWLVENSDGTYSYSDSAASGTEFTTDSKGEIKLSCVLLGTFYAYETEAAEGYDITTQEGYMNANGNDPYTFSTDNKWAYLGETTLGTNENSLEFTLTNKALAKLEIKKQDATTGITLSGAEFKIYAVCLDGTQGWLSGDVDGAKTYLSSVNDSNVGIYSDATIIEKLKYGTYYIYEVTSPTGYDITKQDGYQQSSKTLTGDWAYMGSIVIDNCSPSETEVIPYTYVALNKKIVDKLEGYVWIDEPDTKANATDSIYNSSTNDYLKSGITVNLYDGNGTLIATTTTDSNGYYSFTTKNASSYTGEDKNIYYWDLATAYVEFIYNNKTTYTDATNTTVNEYGFIATDPFVGTDISVNSKAQEYTVDIEELDDNNLTGTTGNYPGKAVTYQGSTLTTEEILSNTQAVQNNSADLTTTPLSGYYDDSNYTVSNINLGLMEQTDSTYSIDETLEYIKITMNGYVYTYNYGDDAVTDSSYVPTTNIQNTSKTFTGSIYPSDIAYNEVNNGALSVYVVYGISVTNTSTMYVDDQYVEKILYLDSLTNVYDDNRYELCTSNDTNDSNGNDFARWSDNGKVNFTYDDGTTNVVAQATYDLSSTGNAYESGMAPHETKTSYVQFKVTDEALEKILSGGLTYEDIEDAPTIATASGYHEYLRTDNAWVHNSSVTAFNGVKGSYDTSNSSGDKYYVHKTVSKTHSSGALYLMLSLGETRTVSGTVFEDTQTSESVSNNTNLGNGLLDDTEENRGSSVIVDLLNTNMEVTTLYQVDSSSSNGYKETDATTTTTTGGTYSFEGVVPGYYYIRFTYGDGTQTIVDASGNAISDKSDLTSNDYKSTIINTDQAGDIIKNAMEASDSDLSSAQQTLLSDYTNEDAKKLLEWYKYITDNDYSTAVDDTTQRLTIDGYVYTENGVYDSNGNIVTDYPTTISAFTPMTSISIENDVENTTTGDTHKTVYGGFNFGVIKEADTNLTIEKKMTNVELTTQTGSTIVSANPTDRTASYITALDSVVGGSKYAKIEIDPEIIYGSGLTTTYTITITNETSKDYIEDESSSEFGYYYKYGEITQTATLKEITIVEVVDEIDSKYDVDAILGQEITETLNSIEEESDGRKLDTENHETATSSVVVKKATSSNTTTGADNSTTTTTTNSISITGWSSIATSESTSTSYTVSSLISSNDDDTSYTNAAQITQLSADTLTTLTTAYEWNDEDTTMLTITPTTGSDRSNTYWVVGIVALVVIAAGFVILKKKVL